MIWPQSIGQMEFVSCKLSSLYTKSETGFSETIGMTAKNVAE